MIKSYYSHQSHAHANNSIIIAAEYQVYYYANSHFNWIIINANMARACFDTADNVPLSRKMNWLLPQEKKKSDMIYIGNKSAQAPVFC